MDVTTPTLRDDMFAGFLFRLNINTNVLVEGTFREQESGCFEGNSRNLTNLPLPQPVSGTLDFLFVYVCICGRPESFGTVSDLNGLLLCRHPVGLRSLRATGHWYPVRPDFGFFISGGPQSYLSTSGVKTIDQNRNWLTHNKLRSKQQLFRSYCQEKYSFYCTFENFLLSGKCTFVRTKSDYTSRKV